MRKFKIHMIRHADEDTFSTMCGQTDESSSERFKENENFAGFGETEKTTSCGIDKIIKL